MIPRLDQADQQYLDVTDAHQVNAVSSVLLPIFDLILTTFWRHFCMEGFELKPA